VVCWDLTLSIDLEAMKESGDGLEENRYLLAKQL
jgi:hypothetical protein